jgi:hypothetical protein
MYGPIMPVMKNSGRKLTITASVARMIGGRTSLTAVEHGVERALAAGAQVAVDVLDVDDRVVDDEAERQRSGRTA